MFRWPWFRRYWWFFLILKYLHLQCFWGHGIHFWYFYWAIMFGWPWISSSTSGSEKHWWLWLIIFFFDFFTIYVFGVWRIHYGHSYWAGLFGWPWIYGSTCGSWATQMYWWLCLMDFYNIFTIDVLKVRESFCLHFSCSVNLENLWQLPVLEVLEVNQTRSLRRSVSNVLHFTESPLYQFWRSWFSLSLITNNEQPAVCYSLFKNWNNHKLYNQ